MDETSVAPEGDGGAGPEATSVAGIVDQVVTLVIAVAIALAIRQFLVEPYRIPSGSMFPTLLVGDHLFVNKLAYGPRLPFTDVRLPGTREPERGDVVVFQVGRPRNRMGGIDIMPIDLAPPGTPAEDFVKRLVGLPGDRIDWRNGQVFVNGKILPTRETGESFVDDVGQSHPVRSEDLGDCRHAVLDDPRSHNPGPSDRLDHGSWVVEPGRYFMMGDNRDNSNDSRGWGTVRLEELKGPAVILYWSWDVNGNMLSFLNPVNWFTAEKRWDRIFQRVRCEPVAAEPAGPAASPGAGAGAGSPGAGGVAGVDSSAG
ncbi:MAG: signal peptidase I [Deltaproteobacteria bacterium]|nr:signal peptidase I [Deltaproteobacteria bacterium]